MKYWNKLHYVVRGIGDSDSKFAKKTKEYSLLTFFLSYKPNIVKKQLSNDRNISKKEDRRPKNIFKKFVQFNQKIQCNIS